MSAKTFQSNKLRWLNSLNCNPDISDNAFRVGAAIVDHINNITKNAWPSQARLGKRLSRSTRTIQRAIIEMENAGLIRVIRRSSQRTSNLYQLVLPKVIDAETSDRTVANGRQICPNEGDKIVGQTYLNNLSRTNLRGPGNETHVSRPFSNRGLAESRIVDRFGEPARRLLDRLNDVDPNRINDLCSAELRGTLTQTDMYEAQLAVFSMHYRA